MTFDPATLSGKRVWLRAKDLGANGSSVSSWTDQSGNAFHGLATGTAPTVVTGATPSGGKVVSFSSSAMTLGRTTFSSATTRFPAGEKLLGDGVPDNYWEAQSTATSGSPHTVQGQLAAASVNTSYSISAGGASSPRDWTMQGSNNGTSWTTLDTRTGVTFSGAAAQSFSYSNSTAYAYYKLVVTAQNGSGNLLIGEIDFEPSHRLLADGGAGEYWIVAKVDTGAFNLGSWKFGTSVGDNWAMRLSTMYDDFGGATQRTYSPSPDPSSAYRLIRARIDTSGNLQYWIDNTSQLSVATATAPVWSLNPKIAGAAILRIAEVFVRDTLSTPAEAAALTYYFNTEHGLTVPGARDPSLVAIDPTVIPGKVLWLRAKDNAGANGSSVTSWTDQATGVGQASSGTAPTLVTSSTPTGGKSVHGGGSGNFITSLLGPRWAASSYQTNFEPFRAEGDDTTTAWSSNTAPTGWLRQKMDAAVVATGYKLKGRASASGQNPTAWTFEGSNDGSSWTTLDTRSGISGTALDTLTAYTFSNSTAYLYYRVNITATNAGQQPALGTFYVGTGTVPTVQRELWMVVKTDSAPGTTNGGIGQWGVGSDDYYPYSDGQIYLGAFAGARWNFSHVSALNQWRLFRVSHTGATRAAWVDNISRSSTADTAVNTIAAGTLMKSSFQGNIAEVFLFDRSLTSDEVSYLIDYVNVEHGLTVAGAAAPPPSNLSLGTASATEDLAPTAPLYIGMAASATEDLAPTVTALAAYVPLGTANVTEDLAPTSTVVAFALLTAAAGDDLAPTVILLADPYNLVPGGEDLTPSVALQAIVSLGAASAAEDLTSPSITVAQSLGVASAVVDELTNAPTLLEAVIVNLGTASASAEEASQTATMSLAAIFGISITEDISASAVLTDQNPTATASAAENLTTSVTIEVTGDVDLGLLVIHDDLFTHLDLDGPQSVIPMTGSAHLPPVRGTGALAVATFSATPISPPDETLWPDVSPSFSFAVAGSPEPFKVQFQLSTSPAFTTLFWSTELVGQVSSTLSLTPGIGLSDGQTYYWRVRSGDGFVWGAWSAARELRVILNASMAIEYVYANVGVGPSTYAGTVEYVSLNTGVLPTPYAGVQEYVYENVGVEATLKREAWEYVYLNTDTSVPVPHIWFAYREYGFGGEATVLYGMGLGTLQAEYDAQAWIDWGPNFALVDVENSITDWHVNVATEHAYDSARIITKGTSSTPPVVNVEHQRVEVIVPTFVVPTTEQGPQPDFLYITHEGGESNHVPFLLYPTTLVPMQPIPGRARGKGMARIIAEPTDLSTLVDQPWTVIEAVPYIVSGPIAHAAPLLGAVSRTKAEATDWSADAALEEQLAVDLGATWRWIASESTISARPDLGTGVSVWESTAGPDGPLWRMYADSSPYLDPTYAHASRSGALEHPALVFPGDAWMRLDPPAPQTGAAVTIGVVAVLHANQLAARSILLDSYVDGPPSVGTSKVTLSMDSDRLGLKVGGQMTTDTLTNLSKRPVAIIASLDAASGSLLILDTDPAVHDFNHPSVQVADLLYYLGRPEAPGDGSEVARMDVLEVFGFNSRLSAAQMWQVANKLDSIYRITG